jgi:sterol desaturase/sphingolipid hydroxylase (fatty acid hydroxylase superfamily)
VVEDFFFHMTHRFMHLKYMYPYFHKRHHEFKVTISIAAEYSHPVDYLISSLIPSTLGANLLGTRMHMFTLCLWYFIRIAETSDGHSGYDFPWSPFRILPFTTNATYHDFHHLKNVGNYSSVFRIWDTIFG